MASTSPATSEKPAASRYSCRSCALRKVKCDKQHPCSACIKHNVACEYRAPATPRRRKKPDRTTILNNRLEQYEHELRQKGIDPETITSPENLATPASTASGSAQTTADVNPLGFAAEVQLVHHLDRSKYLNNRLWTRVVAELPEPADALDHSSDEDETEDYAAEDSTDFTLGLTPASTDIATAHPTANHILELWTIFKENVDPLTKIIHAPTLHTVIEKAVIDLSSIPKPLEALLFAIYGAAVVSLPNRDCENRFGETRKTLLSRYRSATKAALSRTKFLGSANLTVLQAFLILLLSTREAYDSRTLWTLTGLALRMAEGMGLHRDGSVLGLPPFETEIRRRMWWQLKLLDGDSAELSGSDKFATFTLDSRSPKPPLNVNDDQLYPGMPSLPLPATEATDMIFCALRYDLRSYWAIVAAERRQQGKTVNLWDDPSPDAVEELDRAISLAEASFESKYLRYCDPSEPLHLLTTLVARTAISTMRLIAHHPRRWTMNQAAGTTAATQATVPETERRYVWDFSIKCLTQYKMIHTTDSLARYTWHAAFYFRWQALIHILDTLRIDPLVDEAASVWRLVESAYETNTDFVTNTRKALYVAVGNLCLKAYGAREAALEREGKTLPPTPDYIRQLRAVRDVVDAKRKVRLEAEQIKKRNKKTAEVEISQSSGMPLPEPCGNTEQQSGGFFAGFVDDNTNNNTKMGNDNANMDFDMLLGLDDPMDMMIIDDQNPIDWMQWDALISDFS